LQGTVKNIFGDKGFMERNFWEQGNSVKVNFGEHLNLFLRNKGTTVNFHREQGSMHPVPPGGPPDSLWALYSLIYRLEREKIKKIQTWSRLKNFHRMHYRSFRMHLKTLTKF